MPRTTVRAAPALANCSQQPHEVSTVLQAMPWNRALDRGEALAQDSARSGGHRQDQNPGLSGWLASRSKLTSPGWTVSSDKGAEDAFPS